MIPAAPCLLCPRIVSFLASSYLLPFLCTVFLTKQESTAKLTKRAWELRRDAKVCDEPTCSAKKQDKTLYKCRRCKVATYCCHEHSVKHWPAHMSLCKEIQRRCDYPECKKRAQDVKCSKCNIAAYCSEEHRSAHKSAHKSRCAELRAYLRVDA
jgi:hypothetical protein